MSKRLLHYRQMDVARHERESERMFETVRMLPIRWQTGALCDGLEHPEELRAVNPPTFLACENEIAGIMPMRKPRPQNSPFR